MSVYVGLEDKQCAQQSWRTFPQNPHPGTTPPTTDPVVAFLRLHRPGCSDDEGDTSPGPTTGMTTESPEEECKGPLEPMLPGVSWMLRTARTGASRRSEEFRGIGLRRGKCWVFLGPLPF